MDDLVRVDFALIPDEPVFSRAIDASQEITDEYYYNTNIIDAKKFPPHVSLLICSIPRDRLAAATEALRELAAGGLPELVTTGVEKSDGGYVMLGIERTDDVMDLHEDVLDLVEDVREGLGIDRFGSRYVGNLFSPHVSLAKVEDRDQAGAVRIGRGVIGSIEPTLARALELCDIGERSERWDVLASFTG